MTNIFKVLLATCLLGGLVFIFSFIGKEEVKSEQRVMQLEQKLEEQKFDDEFSDAWHGTPGSKIKKQRAENIAEIKSKLSRAEAKRDGLDSFFDEAVDDAKGAIQDTDARLAGDTRKKKEPNQ